MYPPPNTYNTDYHGASPAPPPTAQPGYGNNPPSFQYGQPTATYTDGPENYDNSRTNYAPPPNSPSIDDTQYNIRIIPQPTCEDYFGLSIINLLLCFPPIGIAALIYSYKTQDSLRRGDMAAASRDSRTAFTLNMAALGLGIFLHISWSGWVIYYGVTLGKITNNGHLNNNG